MVVSAPNSAARKRSRPSSSAARDSRVPASDGVSETAQAAVTANAAGNGRAAKAREELAAVPAQDPSAGGGGQTATPTSMGMTSTARSTSRTSTSTTTRSPST